MMGLYLKNKTILSDAHVSTKKKGYNNKVKDKQICWRNIELEVY